MASSTAPFDGHSMVFFRKVNAAFRCVIWCRVNSAVSPFNGCAISAVLVLVPISSILFLNIHAGFLSED